MFAFPWKILYILIFLSYLNIGMGRYKTGVDWEAANAKPFHFQKKDTF